MAAADWSALGGGGDGPARGAVPALHRGWSAAPVVNCGESRAFAAHLPVSARADEHRDELEVSMNRADLDQLPPLVDVPTAADVLGIGRTLAYELVKTDRWPTPVLRIGKLIKIPTAGLRRLLDGELDAGGS